MVVTVCKSAANLFGFTLSAEAAGFEGLQCLSRGTQFKSVPSFFGDKKTGPVICTQFIGHIARP